MTFLDTCAEINVMTRKIMEDAGLAMQYGLKLELTSYINHSYFFLGPCENVKIAIRGLKIRHPIFVIEQRDHN